MAKSKKRRRQCATAPAMPTNTENPSLPSTNDMHPIDSCAYPVCILSEQLQSELTKHEDDQILLHAKPKKQKNKEIPVEIVEKAVKISKAKQKKLDQLAAQKVKQARREELFTSLKKTELSKEKLQLMYSSSRLGHSETLRERLQRSMRKQKLGFKLSEEEKKLLYKQSDRPADRIEKIEDMENESCVNQSDVNDADALLNKENVKNSKRNRSVPFLITSAEVAQDIDISPNPRCESSTQGIGAEIITSESSAMTRLLELRKKNEERRKKQLNTAAESEIDSGSKVQQKYIPTPIPLSTTRELINESQMYPSIKHLKRFVPVERDAAIQVARMQLPVCSHEQEVMEMITSNDVVLICGETGSGKTTQVPQFLYEAGFGHPQHADFSGRIGVTQPRRVATISTAKRVAEELCVGFGSSPGAHVGYQIRYDSTHLSRSTRIKFMTDGILLKEIQQDFLLRQYSAILLDEAHERNINTDILIGLLSRIVPFRAQLAAEELDAFNALSDEEKSKYGGKAQVLKPLKLVIMSATLRVEDFTENTKLFPKPPPVLRVEARQYPVTIHFNKVTPMEDYVQAAHAKIARIHRKLPDGGVLVFLTGQREIMELVRKLQRDFGCTKGAPRATSSGNCGSRSRNLDCDGDTGIIEHDDLEELADAEDTILYGEDEPFAIDGTDDGNASEDEDCIEDSASLPYIHALPLYALLPTEQQMKVFAPTPERHRMVVVATDIAETSLTIPGIKYVVDVGRTKNRIYDLQSGISSFKIQWISKASADQRAGRAGRTGPGHCYRLYSSAVFDTDFAKFSPPEILGHPIEEVVLQMKGMGIENVIEFPFPTPPEQNAFRKATKMLENLGAITRKPNNDNGTIEEITDLGKRLVNFPVAARFAKMLLLGQKMGVLEYTIAIVAGLSGHSPFVTQIDPEAPKEAPNDDKDMENEWRKADTIRRRVQWMHPESDVLSILRAAGAFAYAGGKPSFCRENLLHEKIMQQMLQLREQLTRILNTIHKNENLPEISISPTLPPPSPENELALRQIIVAGFLDKIARRIPENVIQEGSQFERCCAYQTSDGDTQEPVYIHPHSHVFKADPKKLSEFVVYQETFRTCRVYMKNVTIIDASWLASIALNTSLCSYSSPLEDPKPVYNAEYDRMECYVRPSYGAHQWQLPLIRIPFPKVQEKDRCTKYRYVAKAILDGHIIEYMRKWRGKLKHASTILFRQQYNAKLQALPLALQQKNADSRAALYRIWFVEKDKEFLKKEMKEWYEQEIAADLAKNWSTLLESSKECFKENGACAIF